MIIKKSMFVKPFVFHALTLIEQTKAKNFQLLSHYE